MAAGPTYILCIEISNTVTSVAVSRNGVCTNVAEIAQANKAADNLHLLTEQLLKEAGLSFSELHAIGISGGPGSYTGLRIAAAAAKGWCFSLGIPLIAVPTFEGMVQGVQQRYNFLSFDQYVPMIDARRMEVYTSFYNAYGNMLKSFPSVVIEENFTEFLDMNQSYLLFGNGAFKTKNFLLQNNVTVFEEFQLSAQDLCLQAFSRYNNNQLEDVAYFEPNYAKPYYSTQTK